MKNISLKFLNLLRSFNLVCVNNSPTRLEACIDNVIVNFSKDHYNLTVLGGGFADHDPLLFKLHFKPDQHLINNKSQGNIFIRRQTENQIEEFADRLVENLSKFNDIVNSSVSGVLMSDEFLRFYVDL